MCISICDGYIRDKELIEKDFWGQYPTLSNLSGICHPIIHCQKITNRTEKENSLKFLGIFKISRSRDVSVTQERDT